MRLALLLIFMKKREKSSKEPMCFKLMMDKQNNLD